MHSATKESMYSFLTSSVKHTVFPLCKGQNATLHFLWAVDIVQPTVLFSALNYSSA